MNNNAMIRFLLIKGADIEVKDGKGNTPLMAALRYGNFDSANYLLMKGANASVINSSGSTTIIEAVNGGSIECVKLVLAQSRLDVNRANSAGETPLFLAMKKNDVRIMRLLGEYGAVDKRVVIPDVTFGELVEGTYNVKEYGKKTPDSKKSADDTTVDYRYIFRRDGTGTVDMLDPAARDMEFRWKVDGSAVIVEELDDRGYVARRLRFMYLKSGGGIVFEKSDVQDGDVSGRRWEIRRAD